MERLICAIAAPDDAFYVALKNELVSLKPSARAWKLNSWEPDVAGSLEVVVQALTRVLEDDWRENVSQKLPCKFEYQILRVKTPFDHVQVLTRLFSPPDPQSIFYGREVAKLGDDDFVVWVSD
ncbi:MAG: hypothetical protein KIS67_26860 [Verrucomicrobiae bacterium]|nr:hypothetical protein [Verrucomicrobiae bacterium]